MEKTFYFFIVFINELRLKLRKYILESTVCYDFNISSLHDSRFEPLNARKVGGNKISLLEGCLFN